MAAALGAAQAGNEVYVCTDSSGTRVYQNTGPTEQCRRLNLEPVLSIPQPGGRSQGSPGAGSSGGPGSGSSGAAGSSVQPGNAAYGAASSRPSAGPASGHGAGSFNDPGGSQGSAAAAISNREAVQAREFDRLRILESELREEERRLQGLQQRQQASPEERLSQDIARSQASLEALRREIAKVRRP